VFVDVLEKQRERCLKVRIFLQNVIVDTFGKIKRVAWA
jgi:hypothetical protein